MQLNMFSSKSLSSCSGTMLSSAFLKPRHLVKTVSPRFCPSRDASYFSEPETDYIPTRITGSSTSSRKERKIEVCGVSRVRADRPELWRPDLFCIFISSGASRIGIYSRASYSCTSQRSTNNRVAPQDLLDSYSLRISEKNGPSSRLIFQNATVLDALDDAYDGVVINPDRLPYDANMFVSLLRSSIHHWKIKGKKGVWLKLPLERSNLVPVAVKEGFEYHHAERSFVMMTYWIPDGPSHLPSNASHHVGIGGFVINNKDEVLVVQEKHSTPDLRGLWKIPTGFIHESEEIYTGAVREVKEETGIDTEFVEVVAFRHAKNVCFDKSDLFFVCMLRPLSTDIVVDDLEIQAVKWMPLDEFVNQPLIQQDSMFKKIIDICVASLEKRYCPLSVHQLVSKFDGKLSSLYFNDVEDESFDCQAE